MVEIKEIVPLNKLAEPIKVESGKVYTHLMGATWEDNRIPGVIRRILEEYCGTENAATHNLAGVRVVLIAEDVVEQGRLHKEGRQEFLERDIELLKKGLAEAEALAQQYPTLTAEQLHQKVSYFEVKVVGASALAEQRSVSAAKDSGINLKD